MVAEMALAPVRLVEDPYKRVLRLQEEAHGWEVKAHRAVLEARKFEARAARLALKEKRLRGKASARTARSQTIGERAVMMLHDVDAFDKEMKVQKSHQLTFEAEALRARAEAIDSEAEQLRIAAREKLTESVKFQSEAKRTHLEAEAAKTLL